jgi:chemotaxis protein methyltransferase WspC
MSDFVIEALLQKVIGLKVTSIGKATLDRSVQRRMRALSIEDKSAYAEKLHSSALELHELIEEVIIPETWFFRDREPFKAMTKFLETQWGPKHKKKQFRVLSAPCSTGEEPYSLTMTLLNSGLDTEKFTVHGVDISHRSIARAKQGVYKEHSFRGTERIYRINFFKQINNSYILNTNVRNKVHFHTGNVLNRSFMEGLGTFDVIFFRNLLIYFDALARQQAIATLYKILADDGLLFVGHAEANLFNNSPFTPTSYTHAFAFNKKAKQQLMVQDKEKTTYPSKSDKKPKTLLAKKIPPFHQKSQNQLPDLMFARELADNGKLQKATEICEEYLDQCGPSAQAFFLLGIIRDASDDTSQAEKLFRKALFLDPNHEETLVFLSLIAEKTGDFAEAKKLKQRIDSLKNNTALHSSNS